MKKYLPKEALRKMLLRKKEEIIKISEDGMKKFMSAESRQIFAEGQEEGDCSLFYQFEHLSCRAFNEQNESMKKIDLAMRRLDTGTYGVCEECGECISVERLKVIPFALLCRDCQESKEEQPKKRN